MHRVLAFITGEGIKRWNKAVLTLVRTRTSLFCTELSFFHLTVGWWCYLNNRLLHVTKNLGKACMHVYQLRFWSNFLASKDLITSLMILPLVFVVRLLL